MLGIPPTSGEVTIRRAIERSRLSPAERDDAAYVLLNRTRRGAYDKYRSELLQVLNVRAKAQIQCTDNLFASGIHTDFAKAQSSYKTNTSGGSSKPRAAAADNSTVVSGCMVPIVLAAVVFPIILIILIISQLTVPSSSPSTPPRFSSPNTTPAAVESPPQSTPDPYLKFAIKRYADLNVGGSSTADAAEMMRNHQSKAPPKTGVLSRIDDWESVAFGNRSDGYAPLEIKTPRGGHYFIKVLKWGTSQTALTAFIRSGETFETLLPIGSYEIRYANGQNWYGPILDFGPDASYARCDDRFDFTQDFRGTSGYTIELIKQVGGNLETESLSEDEF